MEILIKTFKELELEELYQILQLRSEVFVVEQNCVYQDLDGLDQKATHLLGIKNDKIIAYTRLFKAGDYFDNPAIGRVVVKKQERQYGYGKTIMEASIAYIETAFESEIIELSAQCYLIKFYNELGFETTGSEYLEDDIPHMRMLRRPKS
jgi:ElaA protein